MLGEGEGLVELENLEVGAVVGNPEEDIEASLQSIVGARATINVFPATGIITVEGDVHALDLAHDFFKSLSGRCYGVVKYPRGYYCRQYYG